jgi:hypothetical protein
MAEDNGKNTVQRWVPLEANPEVEFIFISVYDTDH